MQYTVEISALSPLHIGSGELLYRDRDTGFVKKGSVIEFDQRILVRADLACAASVPENGENELRLHLQDGAGNFLLPGSSIKGALKTLWFADRLDKAILNGKQANNEAAKKQFDKILSAFENGREKEILASLVVGEFQNNPDDIRSGKYKEYYGNNFEYDPWQQIRIGDVAFTEALAERISVYSIHGRMADENSWYWKEKPYPAWLIETIPKGAKAQFRIQMPEYQKIPQWKSVHPRQQELPSMMKSLHKIQLQILKDEFYTIEELAESHCLDSYYENLKKIELAASKMKSNEFLIRIGYGSGFEQITGGMPAAHMDDEPWDLHLNKVRPRNERDYKYFPFPKSRRLTKSQWPLGYVQLRILP